MNRRDVITGITSVLGAGILGPTPLELLKPIPPEELFNAAFERWREIAIKEICDYEFNLMLFGRAALLYTNDYPYIKNIALEDLHV